MAFLLEEHSRLDFWNGGDGMTVVMYGLEKVVAHEHIDRGDDDVQEVYGGDNYNGGSGDDIQEVDDGDSGNGRNARDCIVGNPKCVGSRLVRFSHSTQTGYLETTI